MSAIKLLRKIKEIIKKLTEIIITYINRLNQSEQPGSAKWLVSKEMQYGGMHTNVPRKTVSPLDPRSPEEIRSGGMTGGDRMMHHAYAKSYARNLKPWISVRERNQVVLCEVGILRGTGLAIWCDLFPKGKVVGLDIDLSNIKQNLNFLRGRGAFSCNQPELHQFDQLKPNNKILKKIFSEQSIDICIDDGLHSDEAVLNTFASLNPFLSDQFVYFVEDSFTAGRAIKRNYPDYTVGESGELTVVTRRPL